MRVGALQDCPLLAMQCSTPRLTAASSASAKTRLAPLPPSSRQTLLSVSAAFLVMSLPARVDPVKEIMSTSGWPDRRVPTPAPSPLTRLNTPLGSPAESTISANRIEDSGDSSDGLRIMVHPATSAAATLRVTWFIGQFHGVIRPTTPMASRMTRSFGA